VRADLQAEIDSLYALFVNAVERNTGMSAKAIRATQAAVYRGQAAVDIGLASRVATTDQLLSELIALRARSYPVGFTAGATADNKGVTTMSGNTNPGGQQAVQTPAAAAAVPTQADLDASRAEGRTQGATAERERIQAVMAVGAGLPGHGALLQTLAFDGKTTAPEAAMAVLQAEVAARGQAIKAHDADAPKPVASSSAPSDQALSAEQQTTQAKAHAREHGVSFVAALKALGFAA
jgi:hypothetical protein